MGSNGSRGLLFGVGKEIWVGEASADKVELKGHWKIHSDQVNVCKWNPTTNVVFTASEDKTLCLSYITWGLSVSNFEIWIFAPLFESSLSLWTLKIEFCVFTTCESWLASLAVELSWPRTPLYTRGEAPNCVFKYST